MQHTTSNTPLLVPGHIIRKMIARGFSEMYGDELPEYKRFTAPVRDSNLAELPNYPAVKQETLMEEKHGAIRVPGPAEMRIVTRIFFQMGMVPVEFYDMTILGEKSLPMIATAFRPVDDSINESAFRMFCSMLHIESVPADLREELLAELHNNRQLFPKFSNDLLSMLDKAERQGGLDEEDAPRFTRQVVTAFSMHKDKVVDFGFYSKLRKISDPLADIALESPVLNHLTPRALNIRDAVMRLIKSGIPMQTVIQGPPIREDGVSLQLNQIARIAAGEDVYAATDAEIIVASAYDPGSLSAPKANAPKIVLQKNEKVADYIARIQDALTQHKIVVIQHKARFGEIESRGVALTPAGEAAYNAYGIESESDPEAKRHKIEKFKREYPKTHRELHDKGWAYYTYQMTDAENASRDTESAEMPSVDELLNSGHLALVPQTYDDFLPFSAAAIFSANLTTGTEGIGDGPRNASAENKSALEKAMGTVIISRHEIHRRASTNSIEQARAEWRHR